MGTVSRASESERTRVLRQRRFIDTAFVNSSTGWQYCDDSKITHSSERDVVVSGPSVVAGCLC